MPALADKSPSASTYPLRSSRKGQAFDGLSGTVITVRPDTLILSTSDFTGRHPSRRWPRALISHIEFRECSGGKPSAQVLLHLEGGKSIALADDRDVGRLRWLADALNYALGFSATMPPTPAGKCSQRKASDESSPQVPKEILKLRDRRRNRRGSRTSLEQTDDGWLVRVPPCWRLASRPSKQHLSWVDILPLLLIAMIPIGIMTIGARHLRPLFWAAISLATLAAGPLLAAKIVRLRRARRAWMIFAVTPEVLSVNYDLPDALSWSWPREKVLEVCAADTLADLEIHLIDDHPVHLLVGWPDADLVAAEEAIGTALAQTPPASRPQSAQPTDVPMILPYAPPARPYETEICPSPGGLTITIPRQRSDVLQAFLPLGCVPFFGVFAVILIGASSNESWALASVLALLVAGTISVIIRSLTIGRRGQMPIVLSVTADTLLIDDPGSMTRRTRLRREDITNREIQIVWSRTGKGLPTPKLRIVSIELSCTRSLTESRRIAASLRQALGFSGPIPGDCPP